MQATDYESLTSVYDARCAENEKEVFGSRKIVVSQRRNHIIASRFVFKECPFRLGSYVAASLFASLV